MSQPHKKELIQRARELRKNATSHERKLWYLFLSKYPTRFQRQIMIKGFIADFYCSRALLVIELDGTPHFTDHGLAYDSERTDVFRSMGIEVIRFTNNEVEHEFDKVCQIIDSIIQKRIELANHRRENKLNAIT